MPPTSSGEEAAFLAAIEAAPGDDAPWLVYADWLQDRGRDREAAAVRRFLPDIRADLAAGLGVPAVRDRVARQDPGGAGWGLGPPATPPGTKSEPAQPAGGGPGWAGRGSGVGPWLAAAFLVNALVLLGGVAVRDRPEPADRPAPPNLKQLLTEDQLKYSRVVKDGKEYITFPIRSRPPIDRWHPAELPGYTLRVEHARGLVAVAFGADGRATLLAWPCPGIGFPTAAPGRWAVDDAEGVLTLTGLADGDPVRVRKLQGAGEYYQVSWNGRTLLLSRVKSPA